MDYVSIVTAIVVAQITLASDPANKALADFDCMSHRELVLSEAKQGRTLVAIADVINAANDVRLIIFADELGNWQLAAERPSTNVVCKSMFGTGWAVGLRAVTK